MDPQMPDWRVIDAYLVGQATADEQGVVRRWMAASPANTALVERMRDSLAPAGSEVDVDAAWKAVARRTGLDASARRGSAGVHQFPGRRLRLWIPVGIAAALLIAVLIGAWQANRTMEMAAGPGERITRTLADGTIITLNSGSRVRYPRRFSGERKVELDGEALFQVKHDAQHPFRVLANHAVARDLGTRFVVRAYAELGRVDVGVTEGRVSLKHDAARADSLVLDAGMAGHVTADGTVAVDREAVAATMTAWVDGILAFNATPLADVAAQLRRRFGVDIRFEDTAVARRRVSTSFRDEGLTQVFDAITLALGIAYERRGDTVFVSTGIR